MRKLALQCLILSKRKKVFPDNARYVDSDGFTGTTKAEMIDTRQHTRITAILRELVRYKVEEDWLVNTGDLPSLSRVDVKMANLGTYGGVRVADSGHFFEVNSGCTLY
jgi:hypothetical protein